MSLKISACLITLNEEKNIHRCLQSIQGLTEEILVVDSGSGDRTVEIAKSFGARVIQQPWLGYVKQKNFAISQANHSWILSVDADEEISASLYESIQKVKIGSSSYSGYQVSRVVEYQGKKIFYGDWFPDRLVRLFQKEKAFFEGAEVHERLKVEGEIGSLDGYLWHYTYEDREDRKKRIYRYASLWAKGAIQQGRSCYVFTPVIHAAWRFFRGYFVKRGFLNGWLGFEIACGNAQEVYWKYELLRIQRSERIYV